MMIAIISYLLFCFVFEYNGVPTSKQIDYYVKQNETSFVERYQCFVKDTLYDVYIETDDLSEYTDFDSSELGRFYVPNEIIVTNEPKFISYNLRGLSKFERNTSKSNAFIDACVIHEISHFYFYSVLMEMRTNRVQVSHDFLTSVTIMKSGYGSNFIEEGICEYVAIRMGEINEYKNIKVPKNTEELLNKQNNYEIKYRYSSFFVKDFLDSICEQKRLKDGLMIILKNDAPSYEEILNKELYFNRINHE